MENNSTTKIEIPDIEKELDRLKAVPDKEKYTKACLFTLIIYAHEERRVKYLKQLVASILDKFPCRIIFIQAVQTDSPSYFSVNVSNVLSGQTRSSSNTHIRCDQIDIQTSHDQLFRIPFLVIPHIVPDLPVYLLWGQNPFEERNIFPSLQNYAKRVIFDSECADNLGAFCNEMEANLNALSMEIMDINWALVSSWRDVLYEIFGTTDKFEDLKACKSMIIEYNGNTTDTFLHPEIRAIYLQGWLAGILKWKYHKIERFERDAVISYIGPMHPIIVGLSPQHIAHLPSGSINSIEIKTSNERSYFISRKDNFPHVDVHISSKTSCELPFTLALPNIHKGLSFLKEIFFSGLGDHYRETLKSISHIDYKTFNEIK